ncbi:recombination protein RecR [Candidatus Woesebacteria bacterium]|nr:recombination protein RecR [Candidatus Woesebacteria bacterium]
MKLPRAVQNLIEKFEKLPGIGPKSAQRLVFYLLHNPDHELEDFSKKLTELKKNTVLCDICHNVSESNPCEVCSDSTRESTVLCVVEQPLDVLALERSNSFKGYYHVLHGSIAPLNNIGPEQLFLHDLANRLDEVEELIIATNPTMEGEATALYISEYLNKNSKVNSEKIIITRIGHGLPIGADIEYADGVTLTRALEGRRKI